MKKKREKSLITVEASRVIPLVEYDKVLPEWVRNRVAKDLAKFMFENGLITFKEKDTEANGVELVTIIGSIKVEQLKVWNE